MGRSFMLTKSQAKNACSKLGGNGESRPKAWVILKVLGKNVTCLLHLQSVEMLGLSFLLTCKPKKWYGAMESAQKSHRLGSCQGSFIY